MRYKSILMSSALVPAGIAASVGLTPMAWAQERAPATADQLAAASQEGVGTDIVVTGSRVSRSGYDQPTPTVVIGSEFIAKSGAPNVADAINQLPQLRATLTPSNSTTTVATAGKNLLDLRGLGAQRTLVLVDGKRFVSGIVEGPVDVNVIPQALIDGVDLVTGGASAAYGSDAVAGVVNMRLINKLEGFKATVQGGITDHNDFRNYLASIAFGTRFADDRGQLILSAEAAQNSGVTDIYKRGWSASERGVVANPAYTSTNGEPANLLVSSGARYSNSSYGGVINSGPLKGIQFGQGGVPLPFDYGISTTARTQIGGDGAYQRANYILSTPTKRKVGFGRLRFAVSDALNFYVDASYAKADATAASTTREDTSISIRSDNAFLPASIKMAMAARGLASFTMGRFSSDYGDVRVPSTTETWRVAGGANGELGGGWSYDAYYSHGETMSRQSPQGVRITANYNYAVDSVIDPATGAAVCRNLAARAAGCVPINLFGDGSPSAQAVDYVTTDSFRRTNLAQDVVSATLRGNPFETWAGPVSVALGAEYRHESTRFTLSQDAQNFALATGNGTPWNGAVGVKEAFAEAVVPLLEDRPFAKAVELTLAGRVTDYTTSGTVATWKAGATWSIDDGILLRGTVSRDIRAPSSADLFAAGLSGVFTVFDPALNQTYSMATITSGSTDLKPERALTRTFGIVFDRIVPGLRLSADYYSIKIDRAISTLSADAIVRRCYGDTPSLCSLITRDSDGFVTSINVAPRNLQTIRESGLDISGDYRLPLAGGNLALHADVNYVGRLDYKDGASVTKLDGSVYAPFTIGANGVPHWRAYVSASYDSGPASLYAAARYIGPAAINNSFTSKDLNILRVPSVTYVDASVSYQLAATGRGKVSTFFRVSNLFDKNPPLTNDLVGTSPGLYDVIGRTYTVGVRFGF